MPSEFRPLWPLDPTVDFMNHGTFGATPTAVLDAQAAVRQRMEREPIAFFSRDLEGLLDEARGALGTFVGADPDDLAFVDNATTAVNAVLRWLPLQCRRRAADHRPRVQRLPKRPGGRRPPRPVPGW